MSEWPLGTSAIKKDNVRDVKSCHCRKIRLNCKMAWEQNVRLERRSANEVNVVGWISIYFESPIISSAKYLTIQPRKHSIVSKVSFNFKTGTNDPNYHFIDMFKSGPMRSSPDTKVVPWDFGEGPHVAPERQTGAMNRIFFLMPGHLLARRATTLWSTKHLETQLMPEKAC